MPRLTYISLFSGAGVGCYGFKRQGFECVATNELLPGRLDVQRANRKCKYDSGYLLGDISTPQVKDALMKEVDRWRREENLEQVDVVFATPPCQGMSTVNYKKSEDEQVRNSLVVQAINLIREIQPKVFVFENVKAFMKTVCTDLSGRDMAIGQSIEENLAADYHIFHKIINFKDYGVPSSRPRTIVIGTRKDIRNISPLNLFPPRRAEITLRDAIGHLAPLPFAGRDAADPLHFARPFPEYMLPWIENLAEGESAFSNSEDRKPYKIDKDGRRVTLKGAYMGNKYRRLRWDRPCACITTRNDQLASQDTIHPADNRVLSIRELMRLMSIPDSFRWTDSDEDLTPESLPQYLKDHELNIRRCIGEAVPTRIIESIAANIKTLLEFDSFVTDYFNGRSPEADRDNFYIDTFIREQALDSAAARKNGVFYTPQSVVFNAVKHVVPPAGGIVRILEPAVGLGAFLPQVCSLFSGCESIEIDAVEKDPDTTRQLADSLAELELGCNVHVHIIVSDFLEFTPAHRYDYIFTNPPYAKADKPYAHIRQDRYRTRNLFALFMVKARDMADIANGGRQKIYLLGWDGMQYFKENGNEPTGDAIGFPGDLINDNLLTVENDHGCFFLPIKSTSDNARFKISWINPKAYAPASPDGSRMWATCDLGLCGVNKDFKSTSGWTPDYASNSTDAGKPNGKVWFTQNKSVPYMNYNQADWVMKSSTFPTNNTQKNYWLIVDTHTSLNSPWACQPATITSFNPQPSIKVTKSAIAKHSETLTDEVAEDLHVDHLYGSEPNGHVLMTNVNTANASADITVTPLDQVNTANFDRSYYVYMNEVMTVVSRRNLARS